MLLAAAVLGFAAVGVTAHAMHGRDCAGDRVKGCALQDIPPVPPPTPVPGDTAKAVTGPMAGALMLDGDTSADNGDDDSGDTGDDGGYDNPDQPDNPDDGSTPDQPAPQPGGSD